VISFDYSVVASSPERRGASNVGPWGNPSGVEDAVRSVTFCRTSHFAVIATALAGAAAMPIGAASASAQMNDGTLSGTFAAYGTVKVVASKVLAYDTNGLSVTDGFLNHMTWHCSGLADFRSGTGRAQGFCSGNDPVGDQVVLNWESEKHPPDQKVVSGTFNWTGGTGKYAGIRGDGTYVDYAGEFLPLAEGTVVRYFKFDGNYKLPGAY
jgi:hypothetical protein